MKKLKIYLPVLFLLLVSGAVLYALNLFADMLIHPYWHVPGLTASCSDEQKESSPELCDGRALETVKKKYGDSVEEISLPMEGSGKIQGWHFPLKNADSAVIFVHGAGGDRRNGYRYLPFFSSAGYSYISYDSPNHGISSNDGRGVSTEKEKKKPLLRLCGLLNQSIRISSYLPPLQDALLSFFLRMNGKGK